MPLSNSALSYEDLRNYCDRALAEEYGVTVFLETPGSASHFRQRFYKMRVIDRKESREIYKPDDPRCGRSPYDALLIDLEGAKVHIKKSMAGYLPVEAIRVDA